MVPPTKAVWCRSFLQTSEAGAAVAASGVPVETALATTCVGCGVAEGVMVVAVWARNEPIEDVVTLGAEGSSQQLCRSSGARQQYVP
jgi:hypothetical protein